MEIIIGSFIFGVLAFLAHQWYVKNKKEEEAHGGDPAKCPYLNPNVKSEDIEKNIVETTAPVVGKVVSAEIVTQPKETPVATPAVESKPAPVKEQAWTKNPPASIARNTKPKQQATKTTTAPKKRPPAPK
jgi:hypothetical protein